MPRLLITVGAVALLALAALAASTGAPARAAAPKPRHGGYVLDAWGALHPFGGADRSTSSTYWPGQDLARGVAVAPGGGGWVLDAWGGVHAFGGAPKPARSPYWPGQDMARAIVAAPTKGGWVLDAWGGIHAFGGAPRISSPAYWPGQDLARALVLRPSGGGWLVDAWGGVHSFGGAPAVRATGYWAPYDVVRGAVANRVGPGGWVLDMWGALHSFGGAPTLAATSQWPGLDMARGALPDPRSYGGWILDAWGGLHPFGGARTPGVSGYWPGQDLVRGGATGGGASSGHPLPQPKRRTPVLRAVTYTIAVRGTVRSDVNEFIAAVESTYANDRGWAAAGFEFVRVPSGGELTVWLSQASQVPSFGAPCDSFYSCRQGSNAIINDDRFASGSPYWPGAVADYRHMVINHETGHWIGFGHSGCPGPGQPAPVMMQQSKGLAGCVTNPWPVPSELAAARATISARSVGLAGSGVVTDSE